MTRNVGRRPLTPVGLNRQRHGHKRKGKPVEAWKMDLEQDERRITRNVNLNAIEQIADGVEQMMFSWNLDTFSRGKECAKILSTAKLDTIPSVGRTDDEEHSSEVKEDSSKACTICHKFATEQVTTKVTGPACIAHNMNLSCTRTPSVHGFPGVPQFDHNQNSYPWKTRSTVESGVFAVPGVPRVVIRQDRMSGGSTVLEIRRDPEGTFRISTSEKKVGTEGVCLEHPQAVVLNSSRRRSLWGPTPSPDNETLPPTPPSQRDCYPVQEDSCPFNLPGFSAGESHLHVSPRKDEARACHSATPTCRAHHCKNQRANSGGGVLDCCVSHCDCCSPRFIAPQQTRTSASMQLEVVTENGFKYLGEGGRPVTVPMLRNSPEDLANKFESLIHMTTSGAPALQGKKLRVYSLPPEVSSVEELQLALIECATEYEIKTLDARMKMHEVRAQSLHELRTQKRLTANSDFDPPADSQQIQNHDEMPTSNAAKRLEPKIAQQQVKKRAMRSDEMKENIKKSLDTQPWKKKERSSVELKKSESGNRAFSRLFDRQNRSLDDALHRVDCLQREVAKKDQEVLEWQLKEKETKAQLRGLEDKMKKTLVLHPSPRLQASPRLKTRELLMELPALQESLRYSLKAGVKASKFWVSSNSQLVVPTLSCHPPILTTTDVRSHHTDMLLQEEQKQLSNSPLAEAAQDLSDKSMSDICDRDCSVNSRLQFLEERASEMDGLKVTMSKLASNMAELSMAFKDHVQFVNNRLAAIHGFVSNNKKLSPRSRTSPRPRTSPVLETVEAEREILGSPRRSTTSWQR